MALPQSAGFFSTASGGVVVNLGTDVVFGKIRADELPSVRFVATSEAGYETSQGIVLPQGAVVTRALVSVSAEPPEHATPVGGIATVRAAAGDPGSPSKQLVVDFGALRTVSSVDAPGAVQSVAAWRGTSFDQAVVADAKGSTYVEFTEVQTERLLITLAASASPASFADAATVTTTTPPADLELVVAGERAWARPGPVPQDFAEQVDVTAALQTALDAAPSGTDGNVTVPVTLRARVPGTLGLEPSQPIAYLRTHTVAFAGGATTPRAFDEEGELLVALPLPAGAEHWVVHRVLATVVATDDDPRRVQPPVGPPATDQTQLVLDPDRRLVVRVPPERLAPFAQLTGLRVRAQPAAGGVELAGALLADAGGVPGDPLPKGTLAPLTLDAAASAFVTIALPQPLKVAAGEPLWFSLAAVRGSAEIELGAGGGAVQDATLRRVMPNGAVRMMSSAGGVRTDVLRLRLVGVPPELSPIDVVSVDLDGGGVVHEDIEPALAAGGLVSLAPVTPAARLGLALRLTATAATAVTIGPVVVAYADPATGGSP